MERAHDAEFLQRAAAGAVVAIVIEVRAVDDSGEAALFRECDHMREQCVLAEVAAIRRICGDARDGERIERHDDVFDAPRSAERGGLVDVALRHERRRCRERDGLRPQHLVRDVQEERRVDARGEGDGGGGEGVEGLLERLIFDRKRLFHWERPLSIESLPLRGRWRPQADGKGVGGRA